MRIGLSNIHEFKTPLRVFMVDDDPDDIYLTKALSKRSDVPIDFLGFESGRALFDYIEKNAVDTIDLILLDIHMPIDSGYDVLNKLRASPFNDEVTIVMFSTSDHPHQRNLALELGGNGFIVKPNNAEEKNTFFELLSACYYGHPSDLLTRGGRLKTSS